MGTIAGSDTRLRRQNRCGELLGRRELNGYIASFDAIVASRMFGVGENGADIVGSAQGIRCPSDREEFVLSADEVTAIADILGALVGSIEQSKRELAFGSRQFTSPKWIDDMPSVNAGPHVAVSARARDIKHSHPFHEERSFLGVEDGKSLIYLNLECIAFHLTEIGVNRGVQSDIRSDSVLGTQARRGFVDEVIPGITRRARLVESVGDAGKQLDQSWLFEVFEYQMRMTFEHPLARQDFGPGIGHACPANLSKKKHAHPHMVAARKSD